MIFAFNKRIIILNPHKTATRNRMFHFHDINFVPPIWKNEINYRYLFEKSGIDISRLSLKDIIRFFGPHATTRTVNHVFKNTNLNFSEFTKYCFIRNPWDRAISIFFMQYKNMDFKLHRKDFKNYILGCTLPPMHEFYLLDNEIYVDHIFQFERLGESINFIQSKHNLDLPPFKQTQSTWIHLPYKDWFDQEMIDHVANKESKTIELFGYQF